MARFSIGLWGKHPKRSKYINKAQRLKTKPRAVMHQTQATLHYSRRICDYPARKKQQTRGANCNNSAGNLQHTHYTIIFAP